MTRFTLATLGMVVALTLAMTLGAPFALIALLYITVFTYGMDKLTALAAPDHPDAEFPAGDALSVTLGLLHFPLLYGGVWVLAEGDLALSDRLALFLALALFLGQVSNSNAHELIHRAPRWMRRLGVAVYSSVLFGFHASAHPRVHHIHAATPKDPNSARMGEGFWHFAGRAWRGALVQGYRAERRLRPSGLTPYTAYGLLALISMGISLALAGWAGVLALVLLAAYAQLQLLLSDYVQHYGLQRQQIAADKFEPVGARHSWNAPQGFSSALMLNAPRHSDHHAHPARHYPGLDLDRDQMPILPHSLPVMAVIALVPPLWRHIMDPRARAWQPTTSGPSPEERHA
ncbi:alkane 1-monooxygenase [Sagittula marina]|uniref:Alkane 1-monooxygenase n=1 Tax=Sagittula marina TaxID=943940 RepID=A0A7W6DM75_9RHOB|nr:alkane 1-monooxygenase [Sagittula marina]MBB3985716.1 alkane 1-monooxygenase [Sagittula marina]